MKVVVTRAREDADELTAQLQRLGHQVEVCPLIEIEPVGPSEIDVAGYDWVVVTSRNGARELARRIRGRPAHLAAIGPGTAAALRESQIEPELVPQTSTQEGLLAELPRPAGRVLFAGAEEARPLLARELDAEVVPLYRTKQLRPAAFPPADVVVLASASAARAFAVLGSPAPTISIGPATTAAARSAGVTVIAEAETHDLGGLVAAVERLRRGAARDPRAVG